jgi:hypothetical protein
MVERLPSLHKALGLIPSTGGTKKNQSILLFYLGGPM